MVEKVEKSEAEWRAELSPDQYEVLRNKGTERAFTGALLNNKETGMYVCAGSDVAACAIRFSAPGTSEKPDAPSPNVGRNPSTKSSYVYDGWSCTSRTRASPAITLALRSSTFAFISSVMSDALFSSSA